MAGLVPAIHDLRSFDQVRKDVDARHKAGHDELADLAVSLGQHMMSNDYDRVPTGTKYAKLIAGFLPPLATWYLTGNVWYAIIVYAIGFIAGNFISAQATKHAFQGVQRNLNGEINPEEMSRALARSLPAFLWAPPICGAIAAAAFIWLSQ
jgi:hypothetical protein